MVRAILEGRKTQTRRVVKHIPMLGGPLEWCAAAKAQEPGWVSIVGDYRRFCPYGVPSDKLWVREAFMYSVCGSENERGYEDCIEYRADFGKKIVSPDYPHKDDIDCKWRPSIHMPRWASRITLEVTGVRVERLQEISYSDAVQEGVGLHGSWWIDTQGKAHRSPIEAYQSLWELINGPGSWEANPWVWVVEFRRLENGH
jgi:hypothetical protein